MAVLVHILWFKFRSFLKLNLEWRVVPIVKNIASLLVFGGFAFGAFVFARNATAYVMDTAHLGLFLLHRFVSMVLFVFFLSVNVGNIIVSYAAFYRSQETLYFLTKPVSYVTLFVIKFLDNFFYSSSILFLIAVAVLFGYGSYFAMPWLFYIKVMVLLFIPFMLISACIAVIGLLVIMRYAVVVGVKNIIAGLVILYLGSLFMYFKMTNPMKLVMSVVKNFPHMNEYFGYLDPPLAKLLPNHWIAESLYWTARGDASAALPYTMLLFGTAAVVFVVMLVVAKKIFFASWLSSMELQARSESGTTVMDFYSLTKPSRFDTQTSVLLKKEFWMFIRDPSQWIHIGIIMVLIVSFLVSVSRIDLRLTIPFLQTVSYMVVFVFNMFLIGSIALRFVFPMVSIEGESFWKVLSAPVERSKVYLLKLTVVFVPLVLVSILLAVFSHKPLHEYPVLLYLSILISSTVSLALVSLNLGAGAFFVNYKEKNPIRVASSQSATLTFLICMLCMTLYVSMLFIPYQRYFEHVLKGTPFDETLFVYSTAGVVLISCLIGMASTFIGINVLRRDY